MHFYMAIWMGTVVYVHIADNRFIYAGISTNLIHSRFIIRTTCCIAAAAAIWQDPYFVCFLLGKQVTSSAVTNGHGAALLYWTSNWIFYIKDDQQPRPAIVVIVLCPLGAFVFPVPSKIERSYSYTTSYYIMDDNSLYVIVTLDRTLPECRITPCVLLTAR